MVVVLGSLGELVWCAETVGGQFPPGFVLWRANVQTPVRGSFPGEAR